MKNNYYNKRFLFEELDIEEQRKRLEKIIKVCIVTFGKIVEQSRKYPEFQDNSDVLNIGKIYPNYILNEHHIKSASDVDRIHNYLNKYNEIQLYCQLKINSSKYDGLYDLNNFKNFLELQTRGYNNFKLVSKDILNLVKKLKKYNFGSWGLDFYIQMHYKFGENYLTIEYMFQPETTNSDTFDLEKEYPQILRYIEQLYKIGKRAFQQYHRISTEGWNNILDKAQQIDPQLYDFLTYDFIENWNDHF